MKPDANKDLMLKCGSKTGQYEPEAPEQRNWIMLYSKEPTEKAMAWIKSKTIAYKHKSPFCVDENERPLYIEHLAADMGWKEQTARNVLNELQNQGRIRFEKRRIWYRADVPQTPPKPSTYRQTEGEENAPVQRYFLPYQIDFIKNLDPEIQKAAEGDAVACADWEKQLYADGMAALRNIAEQRKDTMLQKYGIPQKRLAKKERTQEPLGLEIKLLAEPDFVQTQKTAPYNGKNGSVQSDSGTASLLSLEVKVKEEVLPSGEPYKNQSSSSSVASRPQKPKQQEEEEERSLYKQFQNTYPKDHQDPKQKRLFESKPRAEQARIIERLKTVWLNCPRWQDQDGRWIVSSVTFLTADYWKEEPPAALNQKKSAPANAKPSWDEMSDIIEQAKAAEKAAKAS